MTSTPVSPGVRPPLASPESRPPEFAHELVRALPRLRRHVQGRSDAHLVDDVVQDSLLRALEHSGAFDRSRPLWPWLRAIADNATVRRHERESRAASAVHGAEIESAPVGSVASAHPSLDASDEARTMLARLRGAERAVVERHYLQGHSVAHIAADRGVPVGTVKAQLSRARRRLALLAAAIATCVVAAALVRSGARPQGRTHPDARLLASSLVVERARTSRPRFARIVHGSGQAESAQPNWRAQQNWVVTGARALADPTVRPLTSTPASPR